MASYKAFYIQPNDDGSFKRSIVQRATRTPSQFIYFQTLSAR